MSRSFIKYFKLAWIIPLAFLPALTIAQNVPKSGGLAGISPDPVPGNYTATKINYVRTWEPSMPITDLATAISTARSIPEVRCKSSYYDGLGRLIQTVVKGISPTGKDMVSSIMYDSFGREQYAYLPYTVVSGANDGKFKTDPFTDQAIFYSARYGSSTETSESVFKSETEYEPSPLNRLQKTFNSGYNWAKAGGNHPKINSYLVNTVADSVRVWDYTSGLPTSTRFYGEGLLFENVLTDENGAKVVQYLDKKERLILQKQQVANAPGTAHVGWLCTYYVYDNYGNQVFVIPPKAVDVIKGGWVLTNAIAADLCFSAEFDTRNRMIRQKKPGSDTTETIYDLRDRIIAYRDGNVKSTGFWNINYYDSLNRATMNGMLYFGFTFDQMRNTIATYPYNPTNSIPWMDSSGITLKLTHFYYDNYNFPGKLNFVTTDVAKPQAGANQYAETNLTIPSTKTKGLLTGINSRVDITSQWLVSTTYVNDKGRVVLTQTENMMGGKDIVNNLYDFRGKLLSTYLRHTNPKSTLTPQFTMLRTMDYDVSDRIDSIKIMLNDLPALKATIAVNTFDELGRLAKKRLHVTGASTQLETQDISYTVGGDVRAINLDFVNDPANSTRWFGQEYCRDLGFDTSYYNGLVSGWKWKSGGDDMTRALGFNYDRAGRLLGSYYTQQNVGTTTWSQTVADYSSKYAYDANGNLTFTKNSGMDGLMKKTVDSLTHILQPNSNQLKSIVDGTNDPNTVMEDYKSPLNTTAQTYWHDKNGNVSKDLNKGIDTIQYNSLNQPAITRFKNKGVLYFMYNSLGERIAEVFSDSTYNPDSTKVTHYASGATYENDVLKVINHEEGRIRTKYKAGAVSYTFDAFVKDLKTTRVVLGSSTDTAFYVATMETAAAAVEEQTVRNVAATRAARPTGAPADASTNPNAYAAKTNGGTGGQKIGPALVLRVKANDRFAINVSAFYQSATANTSANTTTQMVSSILSAFATGGVSEGVHNSTGAGSAIATNFNNSLYDLLKTQSPDQNVSTQPKSYLTYILFDDQLNLVSSGIRQVQGAANVLLQLSVSERAIAKTGFLYIYVCNESAADVYYDNLVVTHISGTLLEEFHSYPYGLKMAGLSTGMLSNTYAENQYKFNGMKFNKEFGVNQYQTYYRSNDPAIGRWYGYDRKASYSISPYASMNNNPISKVDPMGDTILVAFVVQGKPVTIMYDYGTGKFVNRNGTPLEYKANQVFPKAVMNALSTIRRTNMGNRVVKDLSNSKNVFTIKDYREAQDGRIDTHFKENSASAYGLVAINDPYNVGGMLGGSGGTIYFNTDGQGILTINGELSKEPISELAHEMYHAYEANYGLTDAEPGSEGSPLPGAEYRASFFENTIRQYLNLDLRGIYHTHDYNDNPTQRRLTDDEGQPIWVPIIIRPSLERFPPK